VSCPCGCELSPRDAARERWLFSVMGLNPDEPPAKVQPRVARIESARREAEEPTVEGECPSCREPMLIATYLAEFLKRYGAKWPACCEAKARAA
jgi:hypothetical protein